MNLALKIRADAEKWKLAKDTKNKEIKREADQIEPPEFTTDPDEVNMENFRILPKDILMELSRPAMAVYPVLCSWADFTKNEWFPASQAWIAHFAGVSEPTVVDALDELESLNLLSRRPPKNRMKPYKYKIKFIRKSQIDEQKGNGVYFYKCLIDPGIWAELKPRAKVIYLSMRCNAKQDLDFYSLVEEDESGEYYELYEYDEYLTNRKWDFVNLSLAELCKRAGIAATNYKEIMDDLKYHKLVERIGNGFRVWLKPKIRSKKAYIKKFGSTY